MLLQFRYWIKLTLNVGISVFGCTLVHKINIILQLIPIISKPELQEKWNFQHMLWAYLTWFLQVFRILAFFHRTELDFLLKIPSNLTQHFQMIYVREILRTWWKRKLQPRYFIYKIAIPIAFIDQVVPLFTFWKKCDQSCVYENLPYCISRLKIIINYNKYKNSSRMKL